MDVLGAAPLDRGDFVGVPGELKDGRRLGRARELRVVRLIAPSAQLGGLVDADEEVGASTPAITGEGRLVDDLGAFAHRRHGRIVRGLEGTGFARQLDLDNLAALLAEELEIASLVEVPLLRDQLGERLPSVRPLSFPERNLERERGQMWAREVSRQVGRREQQLSVSQEHRLSIDRRVQSVISTSTRDGRAWEGRWPSFSPAPRTRSAASLPNSAHGAN